MSLSTGFRFRLLVIALPMLAACGPVDGDSLPTDLAVVAENNPQYGDGEYSGGEDENENGVPDWKETESEESQDSGSAAAPGTTGGTECGPQVVVSGMSIFVAPSGDDDTENIECALGLASSGTIQFEVGVYKVTRIIATKTRR